MQLALGRAQIGNIPKSQWQVAHSRARELCQQMGKTSPLCPILGGLSIFHYVRAEHLKARELAAEALRQAEQDKDPLLVALGHWTRDRFDSSWANSPRPTPSLPTSSRSMNRTNTTRHSYSTAALTSDKARWPMTPAVSGARATPTRPGSRARKYLLWRGSLTIPFHLPMSSPMPGAC